MGRTAKIVLGWVITIIAGVILLGGMAIGSLFLMGLSVVVGIIGIGKIIYPDDAAYNDTNDIIKRISNTHGASNKTLYEAFKDVETPLGKPWVTQVTWNVKDGLVFGPGPDNEILLVWIDKGKCHVSTYEKNYYLTKEMLEQHKVDADPTVKSKNQWACLKLYLASLSEPGLKMMQNYFDTGVAEWPGGVDWQNGRVYAFDEQFKLVGQDFTMVDMDNNPVLKIEGKLPLKSFHFYDANTNEEVFTVTKRVLHVLDHYDFYDHGELIGSFEQKLDLARDIFKLQTSMGMFEMKQDALDLGLGNYHIRLDGQYIGAISRNLTWSLHNLVFNNYVIWTTDERYRNIIAAFAVMAVREAARDNAS